MAIDAGYKITALTGQNGRNGTDGNGITVQYSASGTGGWHATFTSGDLYMRQSTDGGATWSAAMRVVGEKGAQGEKGETGAQGAKGDKGDTGAQGAKGDKGDKGDTGATGPQGAKGDTGAQGPAGKSYWQTAVWVDLSASTYNTNTWYPVTGTPISSDGAQSLRVTVQLNSGTKPAWSSHPKGFSVEFEVQDQRNGWGTTPATCIRFIDNSAWTQAVGSVADQSPVSYTQMTNSSTPVFYLRGGGKYLIETTYASTWTPRTATYTVSSQSVSPSANTRPSPRGTYVVGATGAKGDKGDKGETGAQGPQGNPGTNGNDGKGIGLKINYSTFSSADAGEIYVHGYSNGSPADVNGFVYYSGVKVSVAKTMINPNVAMEGWIAIPTAGGAAIPVYYDIANSQWKNMQSSANSNINGASYLAIAEFINSAAEQTETAALIEPILLSSLAKQIPANYIGIAGTVTNGNRTVTLYNTTNSYEFASLGTKNARTGDCVFCRGVLTPLTGASDSVKALRVYNGYSWQAPKAQDYAKYRDLALLDLAAAARVYKKVNVAIPSDIDAVFDILVTNQLLAEKLTAYKAFIDNLFSENITVIPKDISSGTVGYIGDRFDGITTKDFREEDLQFYGSGSNLYTYENEPFKYGFSLHDYRMQRNSSSLWAASALLIDYIHAYEMRTNTLFARSAEFQFLGKNSSDGFVYDKEALIQTFRNIYYRTKSSRIDSGTTKWDIGQNDTYSLGGTNIDALLMKFSRLLFSEQTLSSFPKIDFVVKKSNGSIEFERQGIIDHSFGTNNGYIRYANGLIIQWGVSSETGSSGSSRTITVTGLLFTQTPIVTFSPCFSANDSNDWYPSIMNISASSFTVNTYRVGSNLPIRWIAIGY